MITVQSCKNYYSILHTKVQFVKNVKSEFSKSLASDFNSLDFWNINENKVSEILTFFLNPTNSHGQDDLYLNIFIKKFETSFSFENLSDVDAIVEKRTDSNRRIDIFIANKKTGDIIAIENKIYEKTKDQFKQIDDYLDFLNKYSKNQNFTLFYLAPKNKQISEWSFNEEDFIKKYKNDCLRFINYEDDVIPLIHLFAINTENERVRAFLLDFERKLKNLYMGNSDINETEIIKNSIIESKENLETSFMIFNNLPSIKNDLREKFFKQMVEISKELNITIDENRNRFYLDKLGNNKIAVNFEGRGLIYGIVRNEEDPIKTTYPQIEELFKENFQVSYWWPMWRWMFQEIEYNADFWQAVIDGSAKSTVKDFIEKIINSNASII